VLVGKIIAEEFPMLPNGNPANLRLLYEKYSALLAAYYRAEDVLKTLGDDAGLAALQPLNILIQRCRDDMKTLNRLNLQKLEAAKVAGNDKYPYSVIAWYEDESKDLWENVQ
jgi:hypothetical protein